MYKGAPAIVQRWKVGCEHPLTIGEGRVGNSESSFLDLLYLVIKVRREVVVRVLLRNRRVDSCQGPVVFGAVPQLGLI